VKHAGSQTLDALAPMLEALRSLDGMREKKTGVFYLKSRAFLHFHEDPARFYCDVRLQPDREFERFRVSDEDEQQAVLAQVAATLAAIGQGRAVS